MFNVCEKPRIFSLLQANKWACAALIALIFNVENVCGKCPIKYVCCKVDLEQYASPTDLPDKVNAGYSRNKILYTLRYTMSADDKQARKDSKKSFGGKDKDLICMQALFKRKGRKNYKSNLSRNMRACKQIGKLVISGESCPNDERMRYTWKAEEPE